MKLCDRQLVNGFTLFRAVSKETKCNANTKSWVCFGNMFLKLENQTLQKQLNKGTVLLNPK